MAENGSYRTYEEWKRRAPLEVLEVFESSYRTYEEWKHIYGDCVYWQAWDVLTVPMRNGNRIILVLTANLKRFLPYL